MSFIPYQNYGAGLSALGPVQSMSDRNENQTLMANNGLMFASGGITALAEGGDTNALPKYKYDPVTQTYVLQGKDEAATAMEEELLRRKRAAEAAGGSGSAKAEPSAWDLMSDKDKAAYYAANPTMAAVTRFGQNLFGKTGLGMAQRAFVPDFVARQEAIARGIDTSLGQYGTTGKGSAYGIGVGSRLGINAMDAMSDAASSGGYGTTGPGSATGVGVGSTSGINSMDAMSDSYSSPSGGYGTEGGVSGVGVGSSEGVNSMDAQSDAYSGAANGGLMSLARGGMSHLGDYSDGGRLLRGPGDGVSDSIPATIGNKRPARLADGEFVIPARIVSELGNGSTEAGARKLYAMMDRIQKGRKKSIGKGRVAVNSRADKNLPA
jgi:hypothetical protein